MKRRKRKRRRGESYQIQPEKPDESVITTGYSLHQKHYECLVDDEDMKKCHYTDFKPSQHSLQKLQDIHSTNIAAAQPTTGHSHASNGSG